MLRFAACLLCLLLVTVTPLRAGVLTSIPSSSVDDPKAFWGAVMQEFYGGYNKRLKCWVGERGNAKLCMRPHLLASVEDNAGVTHYAAMSGYAVEPGGGHPDCHACPGKLGLVILRGQGQVLSLVARNSLAEDAGSWGRTPPEEAFRVVRLGKATHGWLMETGFTGQGYTMGGVQVYGPVGDRIVDLGFISAYSDNAGTCGDGLGPCYVHSYEILTDPSASDKPFADLLARKVESTKPDTPGSFRIIFSQDELKYVEPDGLAAALAD